MKTPDERDRPTGRCMSRWLGVAGAFALLLPLLVMVAPKTAVAGTGGWSGTTERPNMTDLVPRMESNESYSESYHFSADLDGGGRLQVDFTISNLGLSDGKASAKVRLELPNKLDYRNKTQVGNGEWSYAKDKFRLKTPHTTIQQSGDDGFKIVHSGKHDGKSLSIDVEFQHRAPMWQPGRGKLTVGDGYYYDVDLTNLRSNVSGTAVVGESSHEFTGKRAGYGDHVATNIAPYELAKRISYSIVYSEDRDVFAIWRNVELTEQYGGGSHAYIVVGYGDEIVFSGADVSFKDGEYERHEGSGYSVPHAVQLEGESGDDSVKLVMRADERDSRNLLSGRSRMVRMLASSLTKPFHFDFKGTYALQMSIEGVDATVRGDGEYHFDVLND